MTYVSLVLEKLNRAAKKSTGTKEKPFLSLDHIIKLSFDKKDMSFVSSDINFLVSLLSILQKSQTAESLLIDLADKGFYIKLDALPGYESCFVPEEKGIVLGAGSQFFGHKQKIRIAIALTHQLRRAWQYSEKLSADDHLPFHNATRTFRSEEADAEAVAVLIAWELKKAGEPEAWRHWISGKQGDIALAFAEQIDLHPKAEFDGTALRAAYDHWFLSEERMQKTDDRALKALGFEDDDIWPQKWRIMPLRDVGAGALDMNDLLDLDNLTSSFTKTEIVA